MTDIKAKIEDFVKSYGERIFQSENEIEYWRTLIACLREENFLENRDIEIIEEFLMYEENSFFSKKRVLTESEKGAFLVGILPKLLQTERIFQEKDHVIYTGLDIKLREANIEGNAETFFADVRKYYILFEMYKNKYNILKEKLEFQVQYKQYGKQFGLPGEYYCYSPIMEINIGNIPSVTLLKKKPDDLCNKVEYNYDKNGSLIISNEYGSEGKLYSCEFLLYAGKWLMNLCYDNKEKIGYIALRKYEKGVVLEYERVCLTCCRYSVKGLCSRINKERYKYSEDGVLKTAVEEEYMFPMLDERTGRNISGILRRTEMSFERNKEGIIGEWRQEFAGDKARYEPGYFKLNKRERKITKKDRGRWRRPNYFVE